jgi:hypothetical protein
MQRFSLCRLHFHARLAFQLNYFRLSEKRQTPGLKTLLIRPLSGG